MPILKTSGVQPRTSEMRKNMSGIALLTMVVASAAIDIDLGRQLFVDDCLVDLTQGVTRVNNQSPDEGVRRARDV